MPIQIDLCNLAIACRCTSDARRIPSQRCNTNARPSFALHRSAQWSTFVARFSIQFLYETKAITFFAYLRLSKIYFTRSNKIALDDEWIFGIHDWIFYNAVQVVFHARLSRLFLRFYAFSTSYWFTTANESLIAFFLNETNVLFQRRTTRWTSNYTDIGNNNLN